MITLPAELQNDSQSKRLIFKLLSSANEADIPFTGQFLTGEKLNESLIDVIVHSSGRLCGVYLFGSEYPYKFKFVVTDIERSQFQIIDIPTEKSPIKVTLNELIDGTIGIVYEEEDSANIYLKGIIVNVDLAVLNGFLITSWKKE